MIGMAVAQAEKSAFRSSAPFEQRAFPQAAIYCGDGRFADQINQFLHHGLGLDGYDRLAIAGGPACFAGYFEAYREEEGAVSHLRFLSRLHKLSRLILISHEGCGFYSDFLRVSELGLHDRLRNDLSRAARRIREVEAKLRIEGYLARVSGSSVWFEPVAV